MLALIFGIINTMLMAGFRKESRAGDADGSWHEQRQSLFDDCFRNPDIGAYCCANRHGFGLAIY